MNYLIKNIKKLINKIPFKVWKIYVLKREVIDFFIASPLFTLEQLKEFILIKIEAPNRGNIIAGDPFLHNLNTILFESISKKSGLGEIYKYNLSEQNAIKISLPKNKHYSFPRTIKIYDKFFLTLESSDSVGLSIYETDENISFIKKVEISKSSIDLNYHILDPIILGEGEKIILYCTTIENGNDRLLVFESFFSNKLNFKLTKIINKSLNLKDDNTLRLAGGVFIKNKFYISSQNTETSYGSSLNILDLNKKNSNKKEINGSNIIKNIKCKNRIGPHTINSYDNSSVVVIDLAFLSWINIPLKIYHYLIKLFIYKKFLRI